MFHWPYSASSVWRSTDSSEGTDAQYPFLDPARSATINTEDHACTDTDLGNNSGNNSGEGPTSAHQFVPYSLVRHGLATRADACADHPRLNRSDEDTDTNRRWGPRASTLPNTAVDFACSGADVEDEEANGPPDYVAELGGALLSDDEANGPAHYLDYRNVGTLGSAIARNTAEDEEEDGPSDDDEANGLAHYVRFVNTGGRGISATRDIYRYASEQFATPRARYRVVRLVSLVEHASTSLHRLVEASFGLCGYVDLAHLASHNNNSDAQSSGEQETFGESWRTWVLWETQTTSKSSSSKTKHGKQLTALRNRTKTVAQQQPGGACPTSRKGVAIAPGLPFGSRAGVG